MTPDPRFAYVSGVAIAAALMTGSHLVAVIGVVSFFLGVILGD